MVGRRRFWHAVAVVARDRWWLAGTPLDLVTIMFVVVALAAQFGGSSGRALIGLGAAAGCRGVRALLRPVCVYATRKSLE